MEYRISGLSAPKVAQHLLQGTIRDVSVKLWSNLKRNDKEEILNLLRSSVHGINAIAWNAESTIIALNDASVGVDVLRIAALHIFFGSDLKDCDLDEVRLGFLVTSCLSALETVRNEKLADDLISSIPLLLNLLCSQIQLNDKANIEGSAKFLLRVVTTATRLIDTYSNRKKLFVFGTDVLLVPFLDTILQLHSHSISSLSDLHHCLEHLLGKFLFEDIHHMEEVSRVSLESLSYTGAPVSTDVNSSKKRKAEEVAKGGKRSRLAGSSACRSFGSGQVFSYHAGVYSVTAAWVARISNESLASDHIAKNSPEITAAAVESALASLFRAFLTHSRELAQQVPASTSQDSGNSFAVRWRQHVKRVLHLGVGIAQSISRVISNASLSQDLTERDAPHSRFIITMAQLALVGCMNKGLAGDAEGTGGTIPIHDSMEPYVARLKSMASTALVDATSSLGAVKDLRAVGADDLVVADSVRTVSSQLMFLRKLIEMECRVMTDETLPLTLRNLCLACDALLSHERNQQLQQHHQQKKNSVKSKGRSSDSISSTECDATMAVLASECRSLFLGVIHLYGELRSLDTFLLALLEEISGGSSDFSFAAVLLTDSATQAALSRWFGGMPDGQRHGCWEALYAVLVTKHHEQDGDLACSGMSYVHSICALLGALGLSGDVEMPVPPVVLTDFLIQVILFVSIL